MVRNSFVIRSEVNQIYHYQIVKKGNKIVEEYRESLIAKLRDDYPEESEYIELVIAKSS
ncbi:hypothetical protein D3C80_1831170 [compost metagenome]